MKKVITLIITALTLAACGGGGGGVGGTGPNNPPLTPMWKAIYSYGITNCDSFNFGELHYCVNVINAQVGQRITMSFTLSGSGTLYPVEATDAPPPTVRLFVSADTTGNRRWWCPTSKTDMTGPGTYTVSCIISTEWTGVFGVANDPPIGNIRYVGYTMGGQSFAGHGVAARNGSVHFTLNQYDVGGNARAKRRGVRR